MVEPTSEEVIPKFVCKWSVFKVVSRNEGVVSKVVPVIEGSVPVAVAVPSPPDGVLSSVWGRQCIQLWAISLG